MPVLPVHRPARARLRVVRETATEGDEVTAEPWSPDPEARERRDEAVTAEVLCDGCGHPDWLHTDGAGKPGDCLHREYTPDGPRVGRFDCACDTFRPKEES